MIKKKKKKVLLIGWDAADWKVINPLIEKGLMPTMEKLINGGVMGNLATLDPPFSPMLWTSIATGKTADKHGILGFVEIDPDKGHVRPVSSLSRKVKAIWNILNQEGYKSNVVGWWPSHPAEPINGTMVSNQFQKAVGKKNEKWPMQPGIVHPKDLSDEFANLRIHPAELTFAHLKPFVPQADKIDQEKDKRLASIAKILAETATIQTAVTKTLESDDWDFTAVYFDGIDHFCHGMMGYHPPKLPYVGQELFDLYKDVVNGAYIFHDMMLETQIKLAGPDTTVILVSDHGFHSDHLRPQFISKESAGPAQQHRPYGIICVNGPGIKKDERIYGATLLDITPTILSILGLPVGEDMDGVPLTQIFEKIPEVKTISSWEDVKGESGMFPPDTLQEPYEVQAEMEQLVELGYIEKPDEDLQVAQTTVKKETKYNLARVFMGSLKFTEALPLLEELLDEFPKESRVVIRLATCYNELNMFDETKKIIQEFRKFSPNDLEDDYELKKIEENKKGLSEEEVEKAKKKFFIQKAKTKIDYTPLNLLEIDIMIKEKKIDEAMDLLLKIRETGMANKNTLAKMGNSFIRIGKWKDAEEAYREILKLDPDFSMACHGLGIALLKQGKYMEAIETLLDAIGLIYHNPIVHYHLGEALYQAKYYERAAEAFEVSLSMNPNIGKARNRLIDIYENQIDRKDKAAMHREIIEKLKVRDMKGLLELEGKRSDKAFKDKFQGSIKNIDLADPVYVVSGLPRSGTSMMMQMLNAGGMEIFSDEKRQADDSNPKGYYEHELVTKLASNKKWIPQAKGKAVKIISHLLFYLPDKYNYKIIFMIRDIDEVIASQQKMLERMQKKGAKNYPLNLEKRFRKNIEDVLKWAKEKHNVDILYVDYSKVINEPKKQALKIQQFLSLPMDMSKMVEPVQPDLYRIKKN